VQIQAIEDFLRRRGHDVRRTRELAPDLSGVDVAILFNLTRPCDCYCHARNAMRSGVPYVLFPIYWDLDSAIPRSAHPYTTREAVKRIIPRRWRQAAQSLRFVTQNRSRAGAARNGVLWHIAASSHRSLAACVARGAAAVCPNSRAEAEHLASHVADVDPAKVVVVLNGIFRDMSAPPVRPEGVDLPEGPFLLCVANIAPRKNQLNLARAAARCRVPLLLAGKPGAGCEYYVERIRKAGGDCVRLLGRLEYPQLRWLYERSHAHALPSYIETPGLSTLEAAASGCHIVVSPNGPVREYFGDRAVYCEPDSVDSIAGALQAVLDRPRPGPELADFIRRTYAPDRVLAPLDDLVRRVAR